MMALKPSQDWYKTATVFLAGALVSMIGAYFLSAKNVVTKEDLPALVRQLNPYEGDSKDIKSKLDDLKERVILLDAYQKQIGRDVANIAAKAGVSASPVTDGHH
jgi:hypothetical protein